MKQAIKQFLKPTATKLVIFSLFFIGSIFIHGLATETSSKSLMLVDKILAPHYFIQTVSIPKGVSDIIITDIDLFYMFFGFCVGVIYWYLLACLIYFFSSKKNKNFTTLYFVVIIIIAIGVGAYFILGARTGVRTSVNRRASHDQLKYRISCPKNTALLQGELNEKNFFHLVKPAFASIGYVDSIFS